MVWLLGDVFDEPYESDIALDAAIVYRVVGPVHGITAITTEVHDLPPSEMFKIQGVTAISSE